MEWAALHEALAMVAVLAGMADDMVRPEAPGFPEVIRGISSRRREMVEQAIEDISVMMEAGLAALLAAQDRGADTSAAALALWEEFHAARDAVLALAPPAEALEPTRRLEH